MLLAPCNIDDWVNLAEMEMQRRACHLLESYKDLVLNATGQRKHEVWMAFEQAKRNFDHSDMKATPSVANASKRGFGKGYIM